VAAAVAGDDLRRRIGRGVVDHDDLGVLLGERGGEGVLEVGRAVGADQEDGGGGRHGPSKG
jgi:hypothetical protein